MSAPPCGKPNQAKSRFCEFCGQSLENCDESLSRISGVNAASQSASKPSNRFKQQVRPYLPIVVSLFAALLFVGGALVYAYAMSQGHEAEEAVSDVAVPAEEDASASESADVSKNDATSGAESSSDDIAEAPSTDETSQGVPQTTIDSKPVGEANEGSAGADYLLSESDSRYYSESELSSFSDWELYLARNEVFARHGRMFSNEDLKNYFEAKSWYEPRYTPEEFDSLGDGAINEYEKANSQTILSIEQARNSQYVS